jgi:hypothetical protein
MRADLQTWIPDRLSRVRIKADAASASFQRRASVFCSIPVTAIRIKQTLVTQLSVISSPKTTSFLPEILTTKD